MIKTDAIANTIGTTAKRVAKVTVDNLPKITTTLNVVCAVFGLAESIVNLSKNNQSKPVQVEATVVEVTDIPTTEE